MTRITRGALCFLLFSALATPASAQPAPDTIRDLMAGAQDDYERGQFQEAEQKAEKAWAIRQSVDIAVALGEIELKLAKYHEAAQHFFYAQKTVNVTESPEIKKRIDELLAQAKKGAGAIVIKPSVPGCAFTTTATPTPQPAPVTNDPVFLPPGKVTVEVVKEGYKKESLTVTVIAGDQTVVAVELVSEPSTVDTQDNEKPIWPYIVLGGVGAVGLGAGIGLAVAGVGATDDVEGTNCPGDESSCPQAVQDAVDERNTFIGVSAGMFALGGTALAGLIAYAAWPGPSASPDEAWLIPVFGPDHAGIVFGAKF